MDNSKEERAGRPGNTVVENQAIQLDDAVLEKKTLLRCRLVYAGGPLPTLRDCDLIECVFVLEGPALRTAEFLGSLVQAGESSAAMVAQMLGLKAKAYA
jgi:hypothetical protein